MPTNFSKKARFRAELALLTRRKVRFDSEEVYLKA